MPQWTLMATVALLLAYTTAKGDRGGGKINFGKPNEGETGTVEPYPYLNGGAFIGPAVSDSPDPLVTYRWDTNVNTTQLQIYNLLPVSATTDQPSSFTNLGSLTSKSPNVTVSGNGSIILDFGVESAAWLEFDSPDLALTPNTSMVLMSISEYNKPAVVNSGVTYRVKTAQPIQYNTTFRLELNDQLYEGVRFGWIHVNTGQMVWHITAVRAVCQIKPTNYTGSLDTSSSLFNRIWYTGAYTVKVNLLEDAFGSILMDRGDRISWTGDAHTSQACALVSLSNYDFIRQNIERTANQSNGIESYSLYWVLSLLDYLWYTGDTVTFVSYIPNVESKIAHALSIWGTNSALGFFGHDVRTGCCFENPSCEENQNAYMMLALRILNEYSEALGALNMTESQVKYQAYYNALVEKIRSNPTWYDSFGIHACTEAINAGFTTPEERLAIYQQVFCDPIQLVSYAPFNQYFIVTALGRMGQMETALEATVLSWGGQLSLGATTFWEVYSSQWNNFMNPHDPPVNGQNGYTSMCHPWAGGITRWLSENVLGITPISPGFKRYLAAPYISQAFNLTKIAGTVNTPLGPITATFDFYQGFMSVTAPEGSLGQIGIPKNRHVITKISHGSEVLYLFNAFKSANVDEEANYIYINTIPPGEHEFFVSYEKTETKHNPRKEGRYAGAYLGNDTQTRGNWTSKYGKEGYYLFAYNNVNPWDNLPYFVDSFSYNSVSGVGDPQMRHYRNATTDDRSLQNPFNNGSRALGIMASRDPAACFQTIHIDIFLSKPMQFYLTLYLVDYEENHTEMVVEMYDANTKNIIAPYQFITNFENGIYLKYMYNNSLEVRLSQVRGGNAVISGLFFDV
eukprot:Phypoly_transcript_00732.p1 GENE.Phypoly_transcript_00732~~Phypoly_transcript_00732.p1  ORF type:complete len:853 (+),score=76.09 Phypoly_transcript_00732:1556-4114(+)